MRPIIRNMIRMESLYDGSPLDLEAFALANDALDVADENERRIRESQKT